MTRGDIITGALKIIGDANLRSEARNWLDNVLYELESMAYWRFLEKEVTYQTQTGVNTKTFDSLLMADYSKGLTIRSSEPRTLIQTSKAAIDEMADGADGFPTQFAIWVNGICLYPTPTITKLPILTLKYYKEMPTPLTAKDTDDMLTITGIKPKWQRFLIDGVIAEGLAYIDDPRRDNYRQLFDRHVMIMVKDNEDFRTVKESTFDASSLIRIQHAQTT